MGKTTVGSNPISTANKKEARAMNEEDELTEEFNEPETIEEGVPKEYFTCFSCDGLGTCKYAWDPYNKDGNCLAEN